MKITHLFFLGLLMCTVSIHSVKEETNQPSATKDPKRGRKRGRKRSYTKEVAAPVITKQEVTEYLSVPNATITPITVTHRAEDEKKLNLFFNRIEFTHSGISSFFAHTFNRREYGADFLPHNFTHLAQFMEYGQQAGQSPEFTEGVLRLFNQKLKMSSYVSAPAFERLLLQTTPYFEYQLAQKEMPLWQEIKTHVTHAFKSKFTFLQQNPLRFFDDLSKELSDKVIAQATTPERVRFTLLRLLTSTSDKLVWSPVDQAQTWASFKSIGSAIERLHKKKVIPDELDANDLYWSLVERYAYFMELVGSQLDLETCEKIKQDLKDRKVAWLETPEQEAGLQKKVERLAEVLIETEAKIRASKHGLITDGVILS
ncbi:MAG: hypothetical protein ACJAZS_000337 [Alteromonas naphthalenivorans]|jgi:hypothetical protein